jgi:hypothetical protein
MSDAAAGLLSGVVVFFNVTYILTEYFAWQHRQKLMDVILNWYEDHDEDEDSETD